MKKDITDRLLEREADAGDYDYTLYVDAVRTIEDLRAASITMGRTVTDQLAEIKRLRRLLREELR